MSRGTVGFVVGVAILVGIVALVGASFFSSSQAEAVRVFAKQGDVTIQKTTDAKIKVVEEDLAAGEFSSVSGDDGSFQELSVEAGMDVTGTVSLVGDQEIEGSLKVFPGEDADAPELEVVEGDVKVAQLTSYGNIQNENGSFVVDEFGQLQAKSGRFVGNLQANSALFDAMEVNAGPFNYSLGDGGWIITWKGSFSQGAGFATGDKPSPGNADLRTGVPYFYAPMVATNEVVALGDSLVLKNAYFDDSKADPRFGIGWIGTDTAADGNHKGTLNNIDDWAFIAGRDLFGATSGGAQVAGLLKVKGDTAVGDDLTVAGDSTLHKLDVIGNAIVSGDISATNAGFAGLVTANDLRVTGDSASFEKGASVSGGLLDVNNGATVTGGLTADDATVTGVLVAETAHIDILNAHAATLGSLVTTGTTDLQGGATIGGGAAVTGGLTADDVTADTATIGSADVATLTAGTADIAGNASIGGTLTVAAIESSTSLLVLNDNVQVTGDLLVDGAIFGSVSSNSGTLGSLVVTGTTDLQGGATISNGATVTGGLAADDVTASSATVASLTATNAKFTVVEAKDVSIVGTLAVTSATTVTISAPMNVTKDLEVGQKIIAADATLAQGNVTGTLTAATLDGTTGNIDTVNATTVNADTVAIANDLQLTSAMIDTNNTPFMVDVDNDGTADLQVDADDEELHAGDLVVQTVTASGDVIVDTGHVRTVGGIDNGTGNWSGTVTVTGGGTASGSIDLGFAPSAVVLTPMSDPTASGATTWWVDVAGTTFTANVDASTSDLTFSYIAIR